MNQWNGRFDFPHIIAKIRRKIAGAIKYDRTVLLDFSDVHRIDVTSFRAITSGWPEDQVRTILPRNMKPS